MQQDNITIDLKLPTGWEDLNNPLTFGKKKKLFSFCSHSNADLTDKQEFAKRATSAAPRQSRTSSDCSRLARSFILTAEQVERATHSLGWLDNVPTMPVRISQIGKYRALKADFEGVPFETFIVCDNLYQGYLATKQDNLLDELAAHLYGTQPGLRSRNPRGNSGDIGRTNRGSSESRGELARAMPSRGRGRRSQRRQRRKWFSRKYYASVMRLKEFYEDNVGRSFTGILSDFARRKK